MVPIHAAFAAYAGACGELILPVLIVLGLFSQTGRIGFVLQLNAWRSFHPQLCSSSAQRRSNDPLLLGRLAVKVWW